MKLTEFYPFPGVPFPFKHQLETVCFCLQSRIGYVLDEMGTGKTLSTLWSSDILYLNDKIQNGVLIVAPLSTLDFVWAKELRNCLPHRTYQILHGSKQERIRRLNKKAHFYIINHDGIKTITDALVKKQFDVIIVDELTAFKNATTKRSVAMRKIARHIHKLVKPRALWGLTGAPTANSPLDAFGEAKLITPHTLKPFDGYWTRFRDAIMIQLDMYNYIPRPGWQNIVANILSPSVRHKLRDCIDLPPTVMEERAIEMSKDQAVLYKTMKDKFYAEYQNGEISASNAGVKAIKLLQISSGVVYDDEKKYVFIDNSPKLNELYHIFEESGRDKLLVFATFKGALRQIKEFFDKKKVSCAVVQGGMNQNARTKIYNDFQDGPLNILIAQPATSSHGLTLTASRYIVWFTPVPSNEIYKQANARIVRPGQTRTQIIISMHNSPVERRTYKALNGKENMSSVLLDLLSSM